MKASRLFLIAFLTLASSSFSLALTKIPACQGRPEFISQARFSSVLKGIEALPRMVFVGQKADYYVEGKNGSSFQLWGEQSFLKGESKIICSSGSASSEKSDVQGFSMYAPTLIDLTDKTDGSSYWQFHLMASAQQLGIWNQKSRLFSKTKDLETGFAKIGAHVQVLQVGHDEFELILTRETELFTEVLAIRFDAVSDLN